MNKPGRASHADRWIHLREKLLNRLNGINEDDVLNAMPAGSAREHGTDPAAKLKRALDLVQTAAVSESGDRVDYGALMSSSAYQDYRKQLSPGLMCFDPTTLKSRGERLAFWINLYNVLVLDAVITQGIQHSVTEGKLGLLAFFSRAAYNVGGYRLSLSEIENGILRGNRGHPYIPGKQFATGDPRLDWVVWPPEPRIHFALNCASRSCPPIQVYDAGKIDTQLDQATKHFVNENLKVDIDQHLLIVSSIFQWYKVDFGGSEGVILFILDHLPFDEKRIWLSKNLDAIKIRFEPYDWRLNKP